MASYGTSVPATPFGSAGIANTVAGNSGGSLANGTLNVVDTGAIAAIDVFTSSTSLAGAIRMRAAGTGNEYIAGIGEHVFYQGLGTATTPCFKIGPLGLGFFNTTQATQQNTTGTNTGFTAGAGTAVQDVSTFTGGTGATAYRISDIVKALKAYGLLAA